MRQNIVGTKVLRHNIIPSSTFSTNSKYQNKCWLTLYVYTAWYSKDTGISRSNGNMSKIKSKGIQRIQKTMKSTVLSRFWVKHAVKQKLTINVFRNIHQQFFLHSKQVVHFYLKKKRNDKDYTLILRIPVFQKFTSKLIKC